jgi:alpha-beta hydrolase superfamily lysophospholipase
MFCMATLHVPRWPADTRVGAQDVAVAAADRAMLRAWWFQAPQPNGNCVIILHGIGDSRAGAAGFAPMFLNEGYSVLVPDSRAHGASDGKLVTYGLLERYDVIVWTHKMRSLGCHKLYGLGESLGASILIQAGAVEPAFAAIVAESPYADLREIAEYRVHRMTHLPSFIATAVVSSSLLYARFVDGLDLAAVSPVRDIARESTPILLIHGLADQRTPASNSQELWRANPRNAVWFITNGDHTNASSVAPDEFRTRVLAWFHQH